MGGFFYIRKQPNVTVESLERAYKMSLEVFHKKGLKLATKLVHDNFVIFVYRKRFIDKLNYLVLPNNEFIVVTGTCIYKDKVGEESLHPLYHDLKEGKDISPYISGNFCVIVYCNNKLQIFRDPCGFYAVYCNADKSIISNSFLAVRRAIKDVNISEHEFYEYILHGFFFTNKTFIKEIEILDQKFVWQIFPHIRRRTQHMFILPINKKWPFKRMVKAVAENLFDYFKTLKHAFNNDVATAISGGYDTRLILALLNRLNVKPYLYVYGYGFTKDVMYVRELAIREKLNVDFIDKSKQGKKSVTEYMKYIKRQYYIFDGIGPSGIFDDGADIEHRIVLAQKASVLLNGAGGEIYRECWALPGRNLSIRELFIAKYDKYDYSFCKKFDKSAYFEEFKTKIKQILNITSDYLTRVDVEKLFPFFRNKFAVLMASNHNQLAYFLLPFTEPRFIFQSFDIPFKYKNHGRFQSALIEMIDPRIARYNSIYRKTFINPPPLTTTMWEKLQQNIPIRLRPIIKFHIKQRSLPYYLGNEYITQIFDTDRMFVQEYVDIQKIRNPAIMARALSVEMIFNEEIVEKL